MTTHCFYCGEATEKAVSQTHKKFLSKDHIYPRYIVKRMARLSPQWNHRNLVPSCRGCNVYKGVLHPLDWLVIMPSNEHAAHLAERLVELGEDMAEVFNAMRRRKR